MLRTIIIISLGGTAGINSGNNGSQYQGGQGYGGGGGGYFGGGGGGNAPPPPYSTSCCLDGGGGGGSSYLGGCFSQSQTMSGSSGSTSGNAAAANNHDPDYNSGVGIGGAPGGENGGNGLVVITAIYSPTSQPSSQPTQQPSPKPTQQPSPKPTHQPTQQPSPQPTQQPTYSALLQNPFEKSTWQPAAANARIRFYWFIYASYFLLLFLMFCLLEYIGALRETRDLLHTSALDSNVFADFYSNVSSLENTPTIVAQLVDKYKKREGRLRESGTNKADRIVDSTDNSLEFHQFILDGHTCLGCKPIFLKAEINYIPKGLLEDFLIYLFNNHETLKCFCSYDYFPLTYTAKRLMFVGRHTTLLLIGIVINGLLVFYLNIKPGKLYVINFFLAKPMENLSDSVFVYVYKFIFINLGAILEANMDKSLDIRTIIYYFLCFAFLVVIVIILVIGCIFTTPTGSDNQPYQTRIGLLDRFILQIQFSSFITDFICTVLLFIPNCYCSIGVTYQWTSKGSVYPLVLVGQRFIETEYLANDSSGKYKNYYYKRVICFYFEYAIGMPNTKVIELLDVSQMSKTETNRITTIEHSSSPIHSR